MVTMLLNVILLETLFVGFIVQGRVILRSAMKMHDVGRTLHPFYTDSLLERRSISATEFNDVLSSATTRFVPTSRGNSYFDISTKSPVLLSAEDIKSLRKEDSSSSSNIQFVYLGSKNSLDYIAVDIPEASTPPVLLKEGIHAAVLRNFAEDLDDRYDAALLAYARGMMVWHNNCQHCSRCGAKTVSQRNGASRKCTSESCKASSYPRIEPAAMMLISTRCDNYVLLGRKKEWPQGRFSVLSGFTEVGESLEDTATRETFEESGVKVDRSTLRYITSQPWPFPHSLMLGFFGHCLDDGVPVINFDTKEMEDVRWFSKEDVRASLDGGSTALGDWQPNEKESRLHFPGKSSLARLLITQWCSSSP